MTKKAKDPRYLGGSKGPGIKEVGQTSSSQDIAQKEPDGPAQPRGTFFNDIVFCVPDTLGGSPIWRFFCRYCNCSHTHGVGAGRRVAHCTNKDSPYRRIGYELRLAPQFEEGES
jgi:hypothetical protein